MGKDVEADERNIIYLDLFVIHLSFRLAES